MREYYNKGCSLGHTPSMALLNDLNILPFQERVAKLLKGKNGFKALNGLLPSYIAKTFFRFSEVNSRETRNSKRNLK